MGSPVEQLSVPRRRSISLGGALVIGHFMVASVAQGADVAGLKQAPMSVVDLNAYLLSTENCQPLMDTAEYGRATIFKLISDLAEPLHIFSVTDTGRVRYRKTVLPGHDYSIFVTSGTSLVFIEKNSKACVYRGRVEIEDNRQKYFVSELVAHYNQWK
jgi:hypothetical protein